MFKVNIIRWLKLFKLFLLISSILFLALALSLLVNYCVAHVTYSGSFTMIAGAYESEMIKNLVASNFSLRVMYQVLYGLLSFVGVCFIGIIVFLICLDHHCIHNYKYLYIAKLIIHLGIYVILSIMIFSSPVIQSIDLNTPQLTAESFTLCYDYIVEHQLVNFILNKNGIIMVVLISILLTLSFCTFGFCVFKIMKRKYF